MYFYNSYTHVPNYDKHIISILNNYFVNNALRIITYSWSIYNRACQLFMSFYYHISALFITKRYRVTKIRVYDRVINYSF